ncbi:AMP-binding protein [Gordonia sp. X0973]|uniref:class I adenylate-forming enzyme family protein n=1 Tax=Gordonia sp. X0973 TaxID=2742602 RepID=UPI0013E9CAA0|nr:AMP-binding protein [Gordonia sp. X0973]QKT06504.1 AMP-binding protein [Gordonia sp. X0973]
MPEYDPAAAPTIASVFRRNYVEYADRPAVRHADGSVTTYAELGDAARRLVGGLRARGIEKGDRVAVVTTNRDECFTVDHALAIGGFVRVALSYRLHAHELAEIIDDCGARAVIADGERLDALLPVLRDFPGPIIGFDTSHDEKVVPFADLLDAQPAPDIDISPDDLSWMPYTSGTSGRPKGVMHTHRSLLAILRNMLVETPGASSADVLVHVAPVTHLSGYAMMAYFLRGASHVAVASFDAEEYVSIVAKHRATVLPLVPTMINMILPVLEKTDADLSSVHTVVYGGSPIAPDRLARAFRLLGAVFLQSYGLTEMPFNTYLSKQDHVFDPDGEVPDRLASAGHVSPFVEYRLTDANDEPVPVGEPGEIQVRGDAGMLGYWNLPEETAKTVLPGGWIATGDVGQLRDGYLHVVDRKKDMIVSGGFNVYPTEVENAIYTVSGVAEVAVVGIPSEQWGETVHAVVSVRPGAEVTAAEVEQACLAHIAAYKRPRSIEFVDDLPKTGTGKILRREVKEKFWAGRDRMVNG